MTNAGYEAALFHARLFRTSDAAIVSTESTKHTNMICAIAAVSTCGSDFENIVEPSDEESISEAKARLAVCPMPRMVETVALASE